MNIKNVSAPWPTAWGSTGNANRTNAQIGTQGQLLWSTVLPEPRAGGIVVAASGHIFVACAEQLLALSPAGKVIWTIPCCSVAPPLVLDHERLLCAEEGWLSIRSQHDGSLLMCQPVGGTIRPNLAFPDRIVFVDSQNQAGFCLRMLDARGALLWARPLIASSNEPPLTMQQLIVVSDGAYLRAFTNDGRPLWRAGRIGFRPATITVPPAPSNERIETPIVQLDDRTLIAGLRWNEGAGYYLFDIEAHTVQPFETPLAIRAPMAVCTPPSTRPRLAMLGPTEQDAQHKQYDLLLMLGQNGHLFWHHRLPSTPSDLIADGAGKLLLACSPPIEQWQHYRQWYTNECFVRCIDQAGQTVWNWLAPAPIESPLAIGVNGHIHVIADGQIWTFC